MPPSLNSRSMSNANLSRSPSPVWSSYEFEGDSADVDESKRLRGVLSKISCLKRGSQGAVYLARERCTGKVVAVKRMFLDYRRQRDRGYSELTMREISLLAKLSSTSQQHQVSGSDDRGGSKSSSWAHDNIVRSQGVLYAPGNEVCLVMEHCPVDLASLIVASKVASTSGGQLANMMTMDSIRYLLRCLLGALSHLHGVCHVLHRDVKPGNILLTAEGDVRLSDFGSARTYLPDKFNRSCGRLTPGSVRTTLLFAAPELLMGSLHYGAASDVWSAGVTFAELLLRDHLFKARSELIMISSIFHLVGTPTAESWPEFSTLPVAQTFQFDALPSTLNQTIFQSGKIPKSIGITAACQDLLGRMLTANPAQRITAAEALAHPFFVERDAIATSPELGAQVEDDGMFCLRQKEHWAQMVQHLVEAQSKKKIAPMHLALASGSDDDEYDD